MLTGLREKAAECHQVEVDKLHLTIDWAELNTVEPDDECANYPVSSGGMFGDRAIPVAGEGAPLVSEFAAMELAAALGMSTDAGKTYLGRVLELAYRLPRLLARVEEGRLPMWRAFRIADHTIALPPAGAAHVDRHLAPRALLLLGATGASRGGGDGSVRPRDRRRQTSIGRCRNTRSMLSVEQIREWCGNPDAQITVKPVVDLAEHIHVEAYEASDRLKEQNQLVDVHCVLPHCTQPAHRCDCDHAIPHADGGTTCSCNTAPVCRRHHRAKTHSTWTYAVLDRGTYLWTTPNGLHLLRDHRGTHPV